LTAAQQEAHDKAYAACDYTVNGRFTKGDVISDHQGRAWKIVTYGIRYHEDVSDCIYGVRPARGPEGWKETQEIRAAIEHIGFAGTHEPGGRGGVRRNGDQWIDERQARPAGAALVSWTDARYQSLASFPRITIYEHGIIGVVCPIYDDAPVLMWMQDEMLNSRLSNAIRACPRAVTLPEASVCERTLKLKIEESNPRFAAYMAAREAKHEPANEIFGIQYESRITMPQSEYRRIKAELDAAAFPCD